MSEPALDPATRDALASESDAGTVRRLHTLAETQAPTDLGNAEMLVEMAGERLRHAPERRAWLAWDGTRWQPDATGNAKREAKDVARELLARAVDLPEGAEQKAAVKWAMQSQAEPRVRAMLELAATEPTFAVAVSDLDADPWLLNCTNGTVDLRTGKLREHRPSDLLTLSTGVPFDPSAKCERWERFLLEVLGGDADLAAFIQRGVGYSLTGDTREHVFLVCHGAGCNGKSTLIETLKQIVGEYAATSAFDTFARTRGDRGPRNDLARLYRSRLVTASESGEGRRLDEATVKTLSGGDTVTARFLYGEHFEFVPGFKLWMVTNHKPRVDGDDDALWRRIRLVPFEQSFEGREDRELAGELQDELSGILAWAVRGCLDWQAHGLGKAAAVEAATRGYRVEEDLLGAFLQERCHLTGEVAVPDLREALDKFYGDAGMRAPSAQALGRRLAKRGITSASRHNTRWYQGVSLR